MYNLSIQQKSNSTIIKEEINSNEKKTLRQTQHCALAVVRRSRKFFAPPQTPFQEAQDGQNLISWRWALPLPTDPDW